MTTTPLDPVIAIMTFVRAAGTTAGTRVYRIDDVPQSLTFPYVVVADVSDTAGDRLTDARVQCSCYAQKDRDAALLSRTIRNALHRKTNALLQAGAQYVWTVSIRDGGNTPDQNPEAKIYVHHRDLLMNYDYK